MHTCEVSESIPFCGKTPLILLMSRFFSKKVGFYGKNNSFTQSNSVRAVLEF